MTTSKALEAELRRNRKMTDEMLEELAREYQRVSELTQSIIEACKPKPSRRF